MNTDELRELAAEVYRNVFGYEVSWWSLYPIEKALGDHREAHRLGTFGMECLLPDDKGDMPTLEMLVDGFWLPVPPIESDISAAYQMEERIKELGLHRKYIHYLTKILHGYEGMSETIVRLGRGIDTEILFDMVHATPEDRCLAALAAVEDKQ